MNERDSRRDVLQYRPGARIAGDPNGVTATHRFRRLYTALGLFVLAAIAIPVAWQMLLPAPTLPFLQDGTARTAYVFGVYNGCMRQ